MCFQGTHFFFPPHTTGILYGFSLLQNSFVLSTVQYIHPSSYVGLVHNNKKCPSLFSSSFLPSSSFGEENAAQRTVLSGVFSREVVIWVPTLAVLTGVFSGEVLSEAFRPFLESQLSRPVLFGPLNIWRRISFALSFKSRLEFTVTSLSNNKIRYVN